MPRTVHPRAIAESVAARITALRPGASPPPVEIARRIRMFGGREGCARRGLRPRRVLQLGLDQAEDLAGLRVTPELLLREEERVVEAHLEDAATGRDHPHLGVGPPLPQRGRQTDGPWFVVSDRAVFD